MQINYNEDTEFNDILRAKGIIPPKPKDEAEITEESLIELVEKTINQKYGEKPLEERDLDELDELEDEEDDRVLESYRRKRLAEMQALAAKQIYGSVTEISKPDYTREVTEASKSAWVVVYLYQSSLPACKLISQHLDALARKYPATKFVKIVGNLCIPNYPDRNCPTLIVYGNGDLRANLVGMAQCAGGAGSNATAADVEKVLTKIGALDAATSAAAAAGSRRGGEDDDEREELGRRFRMSQPSGRRNKDDSDEDDDY